MLKEIRKHNFAQIQFEIPFFSRNLHPSPNSSIDSHDYLPHLFGNSVTSSGASTCPGDVQQGRGSGDYNNGRACTGSPRASGRRSTPSAWTSRTPSTRPPAAGFQPWPTMSSCVVQCFNASKCFSIRRTASSYPPVLFFLFLLPWFRFTFSHFLHVRCLTVDASSFFSKTQLSSVRIAFSKYFPKTLSAVMTCGRSRCLRIRCSHTCMHITEYYFYVASIFSFACHHRVC